MHNFNIVYISLFFLVGFGVVSEYIGRRNVSRLRVSLLSCGRMFVRTASTYTLRISNPDSSPSYAIEVHNGVMQETVHRIRAGHSAVAGLHTDYQQRGEAVLPEVELVSYFPLPHMRFSKQVDLEHPVMVLPEPKGISLREMLVRNRSFTGERNDFDGVRRYEHGDSASIVYWPSVAKGDAMMSKQFIFEEPTQKLRFEFARCEGDDEARLSQLTLWVLEAEQAGLEFMVVLPHERLDSQKRGVDGILETLARY